MKIIAFFCAIFVYLQIPYPVQGTELSFRFGHLTNLQGLPSNSCFCVMQDHIGFMWFGTMAGLVRFDGIEIVVYKNSVNSLSSLSYNYIISMAEDKDGTLWIGTDGGGMNRFDPKTGVFKQYRSVTNDPHSLNGDRVRSILVDEENVLWVGTDNGLNRYDRTSDNFTRYNIQARSEISDITNQIRTLHQDENGTLWVGTVNGLYRYARDLDQFEEYRIPFISNKPPDIWSILVDREGSIWLGTFGDGLYQYNPFTGLILQYKADLNNPDGITNNNIFRLMEDSSGYIWIGTSFGLNLYDPFTQQFTKYLSNTSDPSSISCNEIWGLQEDNRGNIWIATNGGGVNKINPRLSLISTYAVKAGSFSSRINAILVDHNENLWIGSPDGLQLIDFANGDNTYFLNDITNPNSLPNNLVRAIYEDSKGNIWICSAWGLSLYQPQTNDFMNYDYSLDISGLGVEQAGRILCIEEIEPGVLYLGTYWGHLLKFDTNTKTFQLLAKLNNDAVFTIYHANQQDLLIGSMHGISQLVNGEMINRYSDNDLLSQYPIWDIMQDTQGRIWAGTNGGGLFVLYPNQTYFQLYGNEIISDEVIRSIAEDDNNNLWLGTNSGLICLNTFSATTKTYDIEDGLPSNEFSANSHTKYRNQLYFGTINGLIYFDPVSLLSLTQLSTTPTIIKSIFINEQLFKQILYKPEDSKITIREGYHSFKILLATLDYSISTDYKYRYKLDNLEKEWHIISANEPIVFTNITYGKYTLIVSRSGNSGQWLPQQNILYITIQPFFYQTIYFKILLGFVFLAFVTGMIWYRTRIIHKRNIILENIVAQRTQELKNSYLTEHFLKSQLVEEIGRRTDFQNAIVHELKTPLVSLSLYSEYFMNQLQGNKELNYAIKINRSAKEINSRIDELLNLAKGEQGLLKIYPKPMNICETIKVVVEDMEMVADKFGQTILFLHTRDDIMIMADETRVKEALINILDNALKYGGNGVQVTVTIESNNENIIITISDNGPGILPELQKDVFKPYFRRSSGEKREDGLGLGLALVKMFIELHGGTITLVSAGVKGSIFRIILPQKYHPPIMVT